MATSAEANKPEPATGYPVTYAYAAPPPQPQVAPTNRSPFRLASFWSRLLCRLFLVVIVIFSIMAVASFATWLILRPEFPEFRVDSASIAQLNTTSANSTMTATWQVSLRVRNPNRKLALVYNTLEAAVLYGEWELDSTLLPPFSQEKGNETRLHFQAGLLSEYVGESVARGIEKERARGEVEFGVEVYGWVRYKARWWSMRWRFMNVYCNGVKIGVSNDGGTAGDLVGQVRPCRVEM